MAEGIFRGVGRVFLQLPPSQLGCVVGSEKLGQISLSKIKAIFHLPPQPSSPLCFGHLLYLSAGLLWLRVPLGGEDSAVVSGGLSPALLQ